MTVQSELDLAFQEVGAQIKAVKTTTLGGLTFVQITQAAYTALGTKDANTVYFIVG